MYEKDITEYKLPNKLSDCPHCGLVLKLYPFGFANKPKPIHRDEDSWHLGVIERAVSCKYSYRILRCKNQHMFIVVGKYTPTFRWNDDNESRNTVQRRYFEILCDEDMKRWDQDAALQQWDAKYLSNIKMNVIKFYSAGIKI